MGTKRLEKVLWLLSQGGMPEAAMMILAEDELRYLRGAARTVADCCAPKAPYARSTEVNRALDLMQEIGREAK